MNVKTPLVVDVAYNNENVNWAAVQGVSAVICKASEGFWIEDPQFKLNWPQLEGKPRAAYHFYRKFFPSAWQAKKFVGIVNKYGGLKPGDKLVLDAEEEGMSISAIIDCMYNIEVLTGFDVILYSRALLLNNLSQAKLTQPQREYLKRHKIWTAGYPSNPDLFFAPPIAYIPDQSRYGQVVLWQYKGEVPNVCNIPGGTDVNWVEPEFLKKWIEETGHVEPPEPPEPPVVDIKGVVVQVSSTADVKFDFSTLYYTDGSFQDISDKTELGVHKLPVEPPPPPPPASHLFDLKIRGAETGLDPAPPPRVGSFAQLGGRGQDNWIELGKNEIAFIKKWVHNAELWNWAASQSGDIYTSRDDVAQTVRFPIILQSSCPGQPRQYVELEPFSPDVDYAYFKGIPYRADGDYSEYTPDKYPQYFLWAYTIYPADPNNPGGRVGVDSHNRMTFLMPVWDVRSWPDAKKSRSAKEYGGLVALRIFKGPHV